MLIESVPDQSGDGADDLAWIRWSDEEGFDECVIEVFEVAGDEVVRSVSLGEIAPDTWRICGSLVVAAEISGTTPAPCKIVIRDLERGDPSLELRRTGLVAVDLFPREDGSTAALLAWVEDNELVVEAHTVPHTR